MAPVNPKVHQKSPFLYHVHLGAVLLHAFRPADFVRGLLDRANCCTSAGAGDESRGNVLALAGLGLLIGTWYMANIYFNM